MFAVNGLTNSSTILPDLLFFLGKYRLGKMSEIPKMIEKAD